MNCVSNIIPVKLLKKSNTPPHIHTSTETNYIKYESISTPDRIFLEGLPKCMFDMNVLFQVWLQTVVAWCSTRTCWPCWLASSAVASSHPQLPSVGRDTSTASLASESSSKLFAQTISWKQEKRSVEQLQDLQADVCGRAEPGVGEDGRVDRVALQVRRQRLHRAHISS